MARIAYMLDRILRVFGLHGCSVMPLIVSGGIPGGCAVPGIMATRTLRSPKEKIATLLTAPCMPCGAKVPVFILLTGAFFGESAAAAMFWITMGAWCAALLVAKILRSTVLQGAATPFVMELPPYRLPTLNGICIHTAERVWQYVKKAGTVILAISVLLWAAMSFPQLSEERAAFFDRELAALGRQPDEAAAAAEAREALENRRAQESLRHSLAGRIGTALEGVSRFAGFDWKTNIALIGGFAAKEVIVSTLGTASSLGAVDPEDTAGLADRLARDPSWSALKAVCLIVFVLLYAPCFVTVVVLARESSWGWALFSMLFNTLFAFAAAALIYQIGVRIL
jgi:ferrous iron transport protein B